MAQTVLLLVPDLFFEARLETAARRMGFKVTKAADWKSALEIARKAAPAGAVLDLGASARAGPLKFLDRVKKEKALAGMRTLGFLDHVRADLAEKARKAGCAVVVTKNALSQDTQGYLRRLTGPVVTLAPPPGGKPVRSAARDEEEE
jgi:ActR/RegA family two-component response regulator